MLHNHNLKSIPKNDEISCFQVMAKIEDSIF